MNPTILRRQQYLPQCSKCCSYKAVPVSVDETTVIASVVPTRIVGTAVPASVVGMTAIERVVPARFGGTAVPTIIVLTAY